MNMDKWVKNMKEENNGKPPNVYKEDDDDEYWVGYKGLYHGFKCETPLARNMTKWAARFLLQAVKDKYFKD